MFFKLFLLFTVVPVVELYLLIRIGTVIGVFETVMVVIITGVIGAWLAKREGFNVLMSINRSLEKGEVPTRKLVEGVLVFIGGALLLTPGFLTDIVGFSFLIPFFRNILIQLLTEHFKTSVKKGNVQFSVYTGEKRKHYDDDKIIDAKDYSDSDND
jgi:UPF0716 protein FxsA